MLAKKWLLLIFFLNQKNAICAGYRKKMCVRENGYGFVGDLVFMMYMRMEKSIGFEKNVYLSLSDLGNVVRSCMSTEVCEKWFQLLESRCKMKKT
jgi:hypothetical protein